VEAKSLPSIRQGLAESCLHRIHQTFTWGKDGKPFFVGGPHDSPARCQQIMNVLTTRLGDGGFGFSVLTDDELSPFDLDEVEMVE
jgi:hypothetical protein